MPDGHLFSEVLLSAAHLQLHQLRSTRAPHLDGFLGAVVGADELVGDVSVLNGGRVPRQREVVPLALEPQGLEANGLGNHAQAAGAVCRNKSHAEEFVIVCNVQDRDRFSPVSLFIKRIAPTRQIQTTRFFDWLELCFVFQSCIFFLSLLYTSLMRQNDSRII